MGAGIPVGTVVRSTRFNEEGVVVPSEPGARFDFTRVHFAGSGRHQGQTLNFVDGELVLA